LKSTSGWDAAKVVLVAVTSALGLVAFFASTIGFLIVLAVEEESLRTRLIVAETIICAITVSTWVVLQARREIRASNDPILRE